MIRSLRVLLLALTAAFTVASPAGAVVTQLGPRPASGGAGGLSVTASPDILRVGDTQSVHMETSWSTFWSPNASNGPWIWRTNTPALGGGVTEVDGYCGETLYWAGSLDCTVEATAPTGGWRTHNFTIQLWGSGGSATYKAPYAVLAPDVYNVGGTLMGINPAEHAAAGQQAPAVGETVIVEEIGGDGEKYTTTTNADGKYDVQVEQGNWRVRPASRKFCFDGSGATCVRQPTTTTPGDRTLNFTAPKPVKISGSVKTKDGAAVKDAWIYAKWTDEEGKPQAVEAKSGTSGAYELAGVDPGATVRLFAKDENVCVQLESGANELDDTGRCTVKLRTLTPLVDTKVDFTKPGCVTKVDFQTSMQATGSCFKTTDPEVWESTEPFRMNGLDVSLHGEGTKAVFDGTARTVKFESDSDYGWAGFTLPYKGVSLPVGVYLAKTLPVSFETALTKITFSAGNSGGGIPASATKLKKLAGFPVTGTESIEMGPAGVTTISVKLAMPSDISKQWNFNADDGSFKDVSGADAKTIGVSGKVTTDNASGATMVEGKIEGIANAGPTFKCWFNNRIFALKDLKLAHNFQLDQWTIGGKMELNFMKKPTELAERNPDGSKDSCGKDTTDQTPDVWGYVSTPGDVIGTQTIAVDEVAKSLEGSVTTTGIPGFGGTFENASFTLDGLNKKGPYGLYFQRGGATIPLNTWTGNNGANKLSAKLGVSVGPRNANAKSLNLKVIGPIPVIPNEEASFDGEIGASWTSFDAVPSNVVAITGKLDAKIWDQPVGSGNVAFYPNQGLIGGGFNLGFTDPTGGTIISVRAGVGEAWYDQRRNAGDGGIYVATRAVATILGHGGVADVIISGPGPMRTGACGEVFGVRLGATYEYGKGATGHDATCDLSAFKADKPVPIPPASASRLSAQQAGGSKSFKLKGGQDVVVFEVATAAGGAGQPPSLELRGPGTKLTLSGTKTVSTGKVVTMLDPLSSTIRVVLKAPKAGTYTVSPSGKNAPAIAAPKFASVLPEPEVTAEISATQCAPQVAWSARGVKGQTLQFTEQTASGSQRVIKEIAVTGNQASGKLAINPLPGAGRSDVSVNVLNNGTPRRTIALGSYDSEASATLAGPSGLRFTNAGTLKVKQGKKTKKVKATKVSWLGICGATGYSLQVGKAKPIAVPGTALTIARPKKNQPVTVTTFGPGGAGGSTLVPYR